MATHVNTRSYNQKQLLTVMDSLLDPAVNSGLVDKSVGFTGGKNPHHFHTCLFCCSLQVSNITCKETISQLSH